MAIIRVGNSFKGFFTVGDSKYGFEIEKDDSNEDFTANLSTFKLDWRLQQKLGSSTHKFFERLFTDVYHFYNEFSDYVKLNVKEENEDLNWLKNPLGACAFVKSLQEDLKTVGEHIKFIDVERKLVHIEVTDPHFRIHKSVLKLNQGYPKQPVKIIELDLPKTQTAFGENDYGFSTVNTVSEFIKKFKILVNIFQGFWNDVSVLDSQCWVLDPANPTYKDTFRRIKLTETLSVGLTINPLQPRQIPIIKLFGMQSDIDSCREVLQRNLENEVWDNDSCLLYNISNILDVTIPNKMFAAEDADMFELVEEKECAICYTWRLNDEIPNEFCETPTCKSLFHSTCLFTYLNGIMKNQIYFGKIQGDCPNCDNPISCSIPK